MIRATVRTAHASDAFIISSLVQHRDDAALILVRRRSGQKHRRVVEADRGYDRIAVVGPRYCIRAVSVAGTVQRDVSVDTADEQSVARWHCNCAERACEQHIVIAEPMHSIHTYSQSVTVRRTGVDTQRQPDAQLMLTNPRDAMPDI